MRAGLAPAVTGARVASVAVYDARSLRRHPGPSEDFIDRLTGSVLRAPERRGKFLWIPFREREAEAEAELEAVTSPETPAEPSSVTSKVNSVESATPGGSALLVHLGMSGQVLLRDQTTDDLRTRIRIELEHPEHGHLRLNFVDQRIFGSMSLDPLVVARDHPQLLPAQVAHIARDPLDPLFDDALFLAALAKRKTTVKRALLDQTLISGIGNIYADESLWAARVHYDQPTASLSRARAKTMLVEVRAVLGRALAEGGTSFDAQYLNVNGQSGYFSHSLNAYGQQGKPCARCGRPIVREHFMNRNSHFCAHCQRVR